jgi:ABC-type phosphate transport system substrate-binding protein
MSVLINGAALAQIQSNGSDDFNGGGSSLAGPTYQNIAPVYSGSTPKFNLTYGISGSGTGVSSFISNNLCANYNPVTSCPPAGQNTDYFAGSDAFLTASQISGFSAANGGVPIVQIPAFATAITIVFNIPGLTTDGALKLTDADLGLIFTGQVTNFNDARLSQNQPTVTLPDQAITVVYRADSSGTSNIFTTHLANVLPTTNAGANQGLVNSNIPSVGIVNFNQGGAYPPATLAANAVVPTLPVTGGNTFAKSFPNSTPVANTPPANFVGASLSSGVQTAVLNTVGAIGYLSPDYTDIAPNSPSTSALPVAAVALTPAAGVTPNYVIPTSANTASAFGGLTLPSTQAQLQNQVNFAPLVPVPSAAGAYPIVGYTYLDLSQCYLSQTQTTDVRNFFTTYYGSPAISAQIQSPGFAPLSSGLGLGKVIVNNIFKTTTNNVDIGNVNVCGTPVSGVYPKGR